MHPILFEDPAETALWEERQGSSDRASRRPRETRLSGSEGGGPTPIRECDSFYRTLILLSASCRIRILIIYTDQVYF